jgi:hypothetical protein
MQKVLKTILKEKNLNISENNLGTDKGDYKSYIDLFYEKYFLEFKEKKINLLEIGFRHGASLCLWSHYFKNGYILGLDNGCDISLVDNSANQKWIERDNITTRICDAYSLKFINSLKQSFDIIIDDGPHDLGSQIKCIKGYYPKLKSDGLLIIEDLLKGYFTCFFLLLVTPINCQIKIFNFRNHKPGRDNMLFVIKKRKFKKILLINRFKLLIEILIKIPREFFI